MGSEIKDIIESLRAKERIEYKLRSLDDDGHFEIESVNYSDSNIPIKLVKKPWHNKPS